MPPAVAVTTPPLGRMIVVLVAGSRYAFSPRTTSLYEDCSTPLFPPEDARVVPPAPPQPAAATAPRSASANEIRRMSCLRDARAWRERCPASGRRVPALRRDESR